MPTVRNIFIRSLPFVFALTITWSAISPSVVAAAGNQTQENAGLPSLLISELQTGGLNTNGIEDGRMEFVELYNPVDQPVEITDWRLEYLSAGHNGTGAATRTLTTFEGSVAPKSYILVSFESYLDQAEYHFGAGSTAASGFLAKGGGHVRLVDAGGATIDLIGWGSGVGIADWWKAPEIPAGNSVQRLLPGSPVFTTGKAFAPPTTATTPMSGGLQPPSQIAEPQCFALQISEILPNPAGVDSGQEFIELYNPTDEPVLMKGCSLRLGDAGKQFVLPPELLASKAYRAFYDSETGIVLPNATAQPIWLLSGPTEQSVPYPNDLKDGQSWSYVAGKWQPTMRPTPGAANALDNLSSNEQEEGGPTTEPSNAACPAGKERNPFTNRCRSVPVSTAPSLCQAGYKRSVETGRCRKQVGVANTLTACKPGQERNLATGRCRAVLGATTEAKPCPDGQARNPDTNRCRKIPAAGITASVQDVHTGSTEFAVRWWIAGLLAAGAIGYAVFEWRQEIWQAVLACKRKIQGREK